MNTRFKIIAILSLMGAMASALAQTPFSTPTPTPTQTHDYQGRSVVILRSGVGDGALVDDTSIASTPLGDTHWVHPPTTSASCDASNPAGFHEINIHFAIPQDAQSTIKILSLTRSFGNTWWYINGVMYNFCWSGDGSNSSYDYVELDKPTANPYNLVRGDNILTVQFLDSAGSCRAASWEFEFQYYPACAPKPASTYDFCPRGRLAIDGSMGARIYQALPGATPPPDGVGRSWIDADYIEGPGWSDPVIVTSRPSDWGPYCGRAGVPWIGVDPGGAHEGKDLYVRHVFYSPPHVYDWIGGAQIWCMADSAYQVWMKNQFPVTFANPSPGTAQYAPPYVDYKGMAGHIVKEDALNIVAIKVSSTRATIGLAYHLELFFSQCGSPTATPTPTNPACPTLTPTATRTWTFTPTPDPTPQTPIAITPTRTFTHTYTWTPTGTHSPSDPVPSFTFTNTPAITSTWTWSPTTMLTPQATESATPTGTATPLAPPGEITPTPERTRCRDWDGDFTHPWNGVAFPNPSPDGQFKFVVGVGDLDPQVRWIHVTVKTVAGAVVWHWSAKGDFLKENSVVEWDGVTRSGMTLANGTYVVIIQVWLEGRRDPVERTVGIVVLR